MSERDCPTCDAPMVEETPGEWMCWCCEWMDGDDPPVIWPDGDYGEVAQ